MFSGSVKKYTKDVHLQLKYVTNISHFEGHLVLGSLLLCVLSVDVLYKKKGRGASEELKSSLGFLNTRYVFQKLHSGKGNWP